MNHIFDFDEYFTIPQAEALIARVNEILVDKDVVKDEDDVKYLIEEKTRAMEYIKERKSGGPLEKV